RLVYKLRADQIDQIDAAQLYEALTPAHTYTIHPELVSQLARPRLPELGADNTLEPIAALQTYLASREDLSELADEMLEAAQGLLTEDADTLLDTLIAEAVEAAPEENTRQLRLL
ncbi:MAG: hypothetical protein F6J97_24840, partial [Leptolyngbya sp. SIO4C1]|nr:hypothetical protein [Leptolyngbya sp. SIO4C1]